MIQSFFLFLFCYFFFQLPRQDSNLEPADPESDAIPLGHEAKYRDEDNEILLIRVSVKLR